MLWQTPSRRPPTDTHTRRTLAAGTPTVRPRVRAQPVHPGTQHMAAPSPIDLANDVDELRRRLENCLAALNDGDIGDAQLSWMQATSQALELENKLPASWRWGSVDPASDPPLPAGLAQPTFKLATWLRAMRRGPKE